MKLNLYIKKYEFIWIGLLNVEDGEEGKGVLVAQYTFQLLGLQ